MSTNKTGLGAKFCTKGGAEWFNFKLLMRSIPCPVVALYAVSVILMNLLANKSIDTGISWFALDGGLTVSWLSFLVMDMVTKRFGAKASIQVSLFAVACNLLVSVVLLIVSIMPGYWGEYYTYGTIEVNQALDATFGGTWYVLLGSTIAFVSSAVVNAIINSAIGRATTGKGFGNFALRSYVSTLIAQFVDNMVFSTLVSHVFFGWTIPQVITCSLTGCFVELLCEVVFSPIGFRVSKKWEEEHIGEEYLKNA